MIITGEIKNPVKAIRAYCLGCCNGSLNEVNLCPAKNCELYKFRLGKNPYRTKREVSEQQKEKARERMNLMWQKKRGETNNGS